MVHNAIMRKTQAMVERMRAKPLPETIPPWGDTTTWAPPPAIAPPPAPMAAPAVASPPAAPGAPGPAADGDPEPRTLGVGYMKGPDGQYYAIDLSTLGGSTTMGPTTPMF